MKACGLTQGALYNHFKSKDELLHDIIASTQAELERVCQQAVAGAGSDPRAKLAAFVRAYVMRHCRLRVEALVANREISWLDAERVGDIRRSRRAIRDIVVGILTEGVERGAVRSAAGRRPARPQGDGDGAARPVDARLDVVRSRAAAWARSRWRGSTPTWRCAPWEPSRVSDLGNGAEGHVGTRSALLAAVLFLAAACTTDSPTAPPPPARARRRGVCRSPARAGRSLARGAGRRRQQQPGLRQRHRHPARRSPRWACATSRRYLRSGRQPGARRSPPRATSRAACARGGGEACLVFMTSHGDESGFFLRPAGGCCRRPRSTRR